MTDNPLRVLVFTNMYPFPEKPFYGSFVADEVSALRRAGCDVDVLFVNGIKNKLNYFASPFRFFAYMRRRTYDLIHVHHSYCGVVATLQKRIPVVWTFHEGEIAGGGGDALREQPIKWLVYWKGLKQRMAGRVDNVIVVAEHLKATLGRDDAVTIPAGIDLDVFVPMAAADARDRLGLASDRTYVLFPSSPARPEKRFELAQAGVDAIKDQVGEVEILCLDNVEHDQVPLYMNAADVLLMTSAFEASPVTVREALACNLPVVSTDVGDVKMVVANIDGCHVVADNAQAIGAALLSVLNPPRRIDGREVAIANYSIVGSTKRLMDVYKSTLERKGLGS